MNHHRHGRGVACLVALCIVLLGASAHAAVPAEMQLQGYMMSSGGAPASGTYNLTVNLWTAQVGGTSKFQQAFTGVVLDQGVYDVTLTNIPSDLFKANSVLWLETKVGTEAPLPRRKLAPTGWAFHARSSETAGVSDDVACTGCVASTEIQTNARLAGDLKVQQSVILCDGGAGACAVRLNSTAAVAADGSAVSVQASTGLKIRNNGNTAWAALESGPITAHGNVSVQGNLSVTGTITGTFSNVPWGSLSSVPAGFADGVDNDTDTKYTAGAGLLLSGTQFAANTTVLQARVGAVCPSGQAIRAVNADGTVVCGAAGGTYTAATNGGIAISGSNEISLKAGCASGQLMKFDGAQWKCDADAQGGASSFSQLSGTATDAQVPDNVTINWAKDSDKVDGHHYSPIWDSTDALTLQGHPASYFATKAEHDALASTVTDPPAVQQSICDASQPTNVCKKDVYMADTHTRDAFSYAALSGGTWVYYADGNRCEYQGGVEIDDPKQCGQDLMPGWMDTTDACGGFRQSTWDTRVRFAVAKDNKWDKNYNYTCPKGYHWAKTEEVRNWFNGPNTGPYTYHDQCGWQAYMWGGKRRYHFRFQDSAQFQGSFKHSGNYDPYQIQFDQSINDFAGIVCVQDAPPGKLDWMITEDDCDGFKISDWDPQFAYAVARKTVFDKEYDYQCPDGWHWATTAEGYESFNGTVNQGTAYNGQCGWNGNDMHNNGLSRVYFRFKDSFKDATTLAYKHSGNGDMYTVQFGDATLGNFAGIMCKKDSYTPAPTDWMDTSDYCSGFRRSTWDPRFYFAVSQKNVWDKNKTYACPTGYHWASTAEVDAALTASNPDESPNYVYHNQCGWSGYYWNGIHRTNFRMSDSKTNNRYIHAGWWDPYRGSTDSSTASFAGIICKKDGTDPYPKPGTTDWMLTDDDCGGFRESNWDSRVRFAVSRQNIWNKSFTYTCPSGYHWGSSTEVAPMLSNFNTSYLRYNAQCGWGGYYWHGRYRVYFRFSDSASNNRYLHAGHGDPYPYAVDGATSSFAGIVCVADQAPTDPTDWMDKSDNCGGFRQSSWDSRVYYAVSKKNQWNKGATYACPAGHHWMTTLEAQAIFDGANQGPAYTYYSQCGWNGYNWHGLDRYYFRFKDSHLNNVYKQVSTYDPAGLATSATTSQFAGIVCMKDGTVDPTDWMEKTDNCGGFRQSFVKPDVFYAVSNSNVWDKNRVYECPTGYRWATTAEGTARFSGSPTYPYNTYHNQCGWSGYDWNPAWTLGCTSYGQVGCGSTYLSPTPTMHQVRDGEYTSGCDECEGYYGTACHAHTTTSDGDGACGGINEAHWRNDQHLDDCFFSANSWGGNPSGMSTGSWGDHCKDGVCCGNNELQNQTRTRYYFRFKDSAATNAHKHAGNHENHAVQYYSGTENFAGIVCIKN